MLLRYYYVDVGYAPEQPCGSSLSRRNQRDAR